MKFEIENKTDPAEDFGKIANSLMNEYVLSVGNTMYRLTDIEFYYFNEAENHADVYTHKHRMQMKNSHWYFHGSGLDMTFGDDITHGGILIRGIKNLNDNNFIDGPIKCVQEFFANFGLVHNSEKIDFYLKEISSDKNNLKIDYQKVYQCRRVGINKIKDTTVDNRFYNSHYRFLIYPKAPHSEKFNIAANFISQKMSEADVNKLFGYKYFKI